jgi:ATP-dependent RNA helicase DDX54/DBP10
MAKSVGFQGLGLDGNLLKGVLAMYNQPTPVQREVLPVALSGRDVACMARTGAGKTASFLIPALQVVCRLFRIEGGDEPVACILSPTRELALQTYKFATKMAKFCTAIDGQRFAQAALVGGESVEAQFDALSRRPATLIATPGRLAHLLEEAPSSLITLGQCRVAVFDEADRLFEMGFSLQLRQLLDVMPEASRQTLLFSATMPRMLAQFARAGLRENVALVRLEAEARLSETLRLAFFMVRSMDKPAALCATIRTVIVNPKELTIVFVATRHHCELVLAVVAAVFPDRPAAAIYGAMDQEARSGHLRNFRNGVTPLLIVTDVAARGLDVPLVDSVINYNMTPAARLFVHRCGRAARQGRPGVALSLIEPDELPYFVDLHTFLDRIPADARGPQSLHDDEKIVTKQANIDLLKYSRSNGWTPDKSHYGSMPQMALDMEAHTLAVASQHDDGTLVSLSKVAANAMQQYRKTRPAASKRAAVSAKRLRLTELHPLFLYSQIPLATIRKTSSTQHTDLEASSLRNRLAKYRPSQSILELKLTAAKDEAACQEAAKDFRETVVRRKRLQDERARSQALVIQDQTNAAESLSWLDGARGEYGVTEKHIENPERKRRLSKAERKTLKSGVDKVQEREKSKQIISKGDYIQYGNTREAELDYLLGDTRKKDGSAVGTGMAMLESALLDVAPDEALDMMKRQSMYRWDARKRKYIQSTVAEILDGTKQRGNKRLKTESGQMVSTTATTTSGDLYRKWREKCKRGYAQGVGTKLKGTRNDYPEKRDYRSNNRATARKTQKRPGMYKDPNTTYLRSQRDELKSAVQIAKKRKEKANLELKNMPKEKRAKLT